MNISTNNNATQKYTSANTSINSTKLPKIYKLVSERITDDDAVIDYGCGKYFDNYNLPNNYVGYDPYNRPDDKVLNNEYDIALCSNVLNVIMEREQRISLLEKLKELAKVVFITVYEGDRSRNSRVTKNDCYQLNWMRGDYIPELVSVFGYGNVKWNKKGYFECWN